MPKVLKFCVALTAILAIAPIAKATSFSFNFTGPGGVSGSGTPTSGSLPVLPAYLTMARAVAPLA
jgi:hypothetical protein